MLKNQSKETFIKSVLTRRSMSNVPQEIKQVSDVVWEIPPTYKQGMNVPARIYATKQLLHDMDPGVFDQVTNVACLPGIVRYAMCMPDGH